MSQKLNKIKTTAMQKPTEVKEAILYIDDCPCAHPDVVARAKQLAEASGANLVIKRTVLSQDLQTEAKRYDAKKPFVVVGGETTEL